MKTISLTATRSFNIFAAGQALKPYGRFRLTGPHFKFLVLLLVACGASNVPTLGSDLIGIYAFVDKVVMEPNETQPEQIQIWGGFAIAEGTLFSYATARRGYLYYKLNPVNLKACRAEWNDLKSVAGTGQIVGFADRYGQKGTLRNADTPPADPGIYPLAMGVVKVARRDYQPINELVALWAANQLPALSISPPLDGMVVISWPAAAAGFSLETTGNLTAPAWVVVTTPIVTREDRNTVTIAAANETKYYRLKK